MSKIMKFCLYWLNEFKFFLLAKNTPNERGETPLIHPEFNFRWSVWQQNNAHTNGTCWVDIKVTFAFDDPKLLDSCPFTCKIAPHLDPTQGKFFGVAYAKLKDAFSLVEWSKPFRHRQLRTPEDDSRLISNLS